MVVGYTMFWVDESSTDETKGVMGLIGTSWAMTTPLSFGSCSSV